VLYGIVREHLATFLEHGRHQDWPDIWKTGAITKPTAARRKVE